MQLYCLFGSFRGRIKRQTYWSAMVLVWSLFFAAFILIDAAFGYRATLMLYPLVFWISFSLSAKRCHDYDKSSKRLLGLLIPIVGPLYLSLELLFRRGSRAENKHGVPLEDEQVDYAKNGAYQRNKDGSFLVNDVTKVNPVAVSAVFTPTSQEELIHFVKEQEGPLCVGGGRFSMGGQTASAGATHIDMRSLNRVIYFCQKEKYVRLEAGARWCDLQRFLDPHDCSVKIMQTYANFTVGGSCSVNCHGRYVGLGPLSLSVRSLKLLLLNGDVKDCSPTSNEELFFGALGGYCALGIILEVELDLAENLAIERVSNKLKTANYRSYFVNKVKADPSALFHNGDLYPPHFKTVNAVTWKLTDKEVNFKSRLLPIQRRYPIHRFFFWVFSESMFGKWYREHIIDPLLFCTSNIRYRNREASYDVAELEPVSRDKTTYVLQEYFVPVANFEAFVDGMGTVLRRHNVNCINVSIRHAEADPRPYLSWAREEVFAFVLYYKQSIADAAKEQVAVWTRELVDETLKAGGSYYLPYQAHPTHEQFHQAFPRARELFALKRKYDPSFRLQHVLWNKYYRTWLEQAV